MRRLLLLWSAVRVLVRGGRCLWWAMVVMLYGWSRLLMRGCVLLCRACELLLLGSILVRRLGLLLRAELMLWLMGVLQLLWGKLLLVISLWRKLLLSRLLRLLVSV